MLDDLLPVSVGAEYSVIGVALTVLILWILIRVLHWFFFGK